MLPVGLLKEIFKGGDIKIKFSLTARDVIERLKKDLKSKNDAVVCKRDGWVSKVIF